MTTDPTQTDIHKAMFMNMILMLSTSVMQQLGKMVNPVTQKSEINLEAAQATIEMIVMLQAKSKGNLDAEEEQLLGQTISALQMNYVAVANSEGEKPSDESSDSEEKSDAPAEDAPAEEAPAEEDEPETESDDGAGDEKEPRFQKSYE